MGIFKSSWEREVDNSLFDYIEVDYFRNYKISTVLSYILMLLMLTLHLALYVIDVYTCVKLLAFNEWSSQVKPYLSFKISKWLFAACIICSVVFLIYDSVQGIRVYCTRNISLIYTNRFAKVAKSLRYKYHCVLNEINPPSGFDKMAFYTYFTLSSSKKLILADSPRQVINALTLYSVFDVESGTSGFWNTLKTISTQNRNEAIILYSMFVSFVIWIFFIGELFFAVVFIFPVYNRIRQAGIKSLRQYVCVRVDDTVKKLAKKFAKKRLLKENRKRTQENLRMDEKPSVPTIPVVPSFGTIPKVKTMESISSFSSELSANTAVDVNPFRNRPQTRKPPPVLNNKGSQTMLSSYASESTLASSYSIPQRPKDLYHKNSSQISVLARYEEMPPAQSVYGTQAHGESTRSLRNASDSSRQLNSVLSPISSHSDLRATEMASPLDIQPIQHATPPMTAYAAYPPRDVFMDEEKYIGSADDFSIMSGDESISSSDSDLDDAEINYDQDQIRAQEGQNDGDYDSLLDENTTVSRAHVRPSLIIRARDMESEDYFKLRPTEPKSYVPGADR